MYGMSELDIEVTAKVRAIAYTNHLKAATRAEIAYQELRPGSILLARESDFWKRLLDVIDGIRRPTADDEFVLTHLRTPIEGVALAKAKAATNKTAARRKSGAAA